MTLSYWLALATAFSLLTPSQAERQTGPGTPHELRVEYRVDPIAVDDARPRFSWELDDARRAAGQSAFQILVATSEVLLRAENGDAWDSLKVLSSDTFGIEYAGKALTPDRAYVWIVRTWDALGRPSPWSAPAKFSAAPGRDAAPKASWIRAGRAPSGSLIGHKSEIAKTEDAWPWVQFDFGGNVQCDHVRLHPARPDGDMSKPGSQFPLRVRVYTDARGKFEDKSIRIGEYDWQDIPDAGAAPIDIDVGRYTLRWLRIVATKIQPDGEHGYAMALGEIEVLDGAQNIAPRGVITVSGSSGESGWLPVALTDGALVPTPEADGDTESLPRLRGEVTIDGAPTRAIVHVAAMGLYEMTVNGVSATDVRLAPAWQDYSQRVAYQTYDIAKLLAPGDNVIGVQLAPGWYAGRLGLAGKLGGGRERGFYGAEPAFYAQGEIVLENGKRVPIRTDESWRWNRAGPVVSADLLDGEVRDVRKLVPGWDAPRFQGSDWRPVEIANDLKPTLFADRADPIRELDVQPALSVSRVGPTTYVYDFGRTLVGVVRIRMVGASGQTVTLRHAEALDANGHLDTSNLGSAAQTDRYTLRNGALETLEPRFTVHGFRYVEVEGPESALDLSSIEAVIVGNDVRDTGSFTCSDESLNRVWRAATASLRSSFTGVPTNCPERDERVGRLGDVGALTPFALHAFDASNFLGSWLTEVRAARTTDGRFPDFAPDPFESDSKARGTPGEADAAVSIPWEIFLRTHDMRLLRSSTPPAVEWVKFVASKNPDGVWRKERGSDTGDRSSAAELSVDGKPCESCAVQKDLFATAWLAHSARIAAKMTFAIGDAAGNRAMEEVAQDATAAFRREFVSGRRLVGDAQGAYALVLDFELYESPGQAQDFADRLAALVQEQGRLNCGIHTAHRALLALSRFGYHAVAVQLAQRKTMPSWGHMIESSANTTWERWDAITPAGLLNGARENSLNSPALGAIGEWMVREIAGLQLVDTHPESGAVSIDLGSGGSTRSSAEGAAPWSQIHFAPRLGGGLTHASAEHRSIAGWVRSGWKLDDNTLTYECTVPQGASATLDLPAKGESAVTFDGKQLAESKALRMRAGSPGTVRIELPAGSYSFRSEIR